MSRKREITMMGLGVLTGLALLPAAKAGVTALTATPSTQTFYVDGKQVQFEAYAIHGNNYVKLRDVGKAVDFGVTYENDVVTGADGTVVLSEMASCCYEITETKIPSLYILDKG